MFRIATLLNKLSAHRKQIIIIMDTCIVAFCAIAIYMLQSIMVSGLPFQMDELIKVVFLFVLCTLPFQFLFKTYNSLWRYATSKEYVTLALAHSIGFLVAICLGCMLQGPTTCNILYFIATGALSCVLMLVMRFIYTIVRMNTKMKQSVQEQEKRNVVIIGAGEGAVSLAKEMLCYRNGKYNTVCFIDDDKEKIGKKALGLPIYGPINNIREIVNGKDISQIILAIPTLNKDRQTEVLQMCSEIGKYKIKILPQSLLSKKENTSFLGHMRPMKLEDLLEREEVHFNDQLVGDYLKGKRVMVTGGGGSIGSELSRQIMKCQPEQLVIVDIYENNAYDIQQELINTYGSSLPLEMEIASVRDLKKIDELFAEYRPQVVFHAAAHKHVPLMEKSPSEAVKNNIFGTYNVTLTADKYDVEKFILISTDKAINPTNVMGATKCYCEKIITAMQENSNTKFVAVRFGNVLGSNGSVIPLFKRQIENGGPITITDKRIIRYFMTIPEAAQLVLEACAMAEKAEVFVLDMQKPVKILTLAENMIRFMGQRPYVDIQINEVGLRPGEKLYEELLVKGDNMMKTPNNLIYIDKKEFVSRTELFADLEYFKKALATGDNKEVVNALKQIVTTFVDPDSVNTDKEIEKMMDNPYETSTKGA